MFGFLAALGPIGIAAAVVGTVGAAVVASSSSSSGRSSNRREVQNDYDEEKKEKIRKDIAKHKESSIKIMKDKYDAEIKFVSKNTHSTLNIVNKNVVLENEIKRLEKETDDIVQLIGELEVFNNESIG